MPPTHPPGGLGRVLSVLYLGLTLVAAKKKNVLFLMSDDLRPEIAAFADDSTSRNFHAHMHTPNLDKLASRSLVLKNAYAQQAICSPSRTSLLTGRRPETTHVFGLTHHWREVGGDFTTIPQYFKQNGYFTSGFGKILHVNGNTLDDPKSWTVPFFKSPPIKYWRDMPKLSWYAAHEDEVRQHPLEDTTSTRAALDALKEAAPAAKTGERPFFLALGFHKPHLPWVFPREFLDYYPEEEIQLPTNPYAPVGLPPVAWSPYKELRNPYRDIGSNYGDGSINSTFPDAKVRELRRAYYAAVSYMDSLVGQVIEALDTLGLSDSTIISFVGDHGYQLGEHAEWCKQTNFEIAARTPMMVHVPGLTDSGAEVTQFTELVDLFPTLAQAAGLEPIPLCPREGVEKVLTCTEGLSMVPLMTNPAIAWKPAVFYLYPHYESGNSYMGYSVRTSLYRFTTWSSFNRTSYQPIYGLTSGDGGVELYDFTTDPEENVNRAYDPSYQSVVEDMKQTLIQGWRAVLPRKSNGLLDVLVNWEI